MTAAWPHWGCARCTPGQEAPHYLGCELIGWNVPVAPRRHQPGHGHPWGAILA